MRIGSRGASARSPQKVTASVIAVVAAATMLAACGGNGSSGNGSGGGDSTAQATSDANAKAALKLLQWHTSTPDAGLGKAFIQVGKDYEGANPNQTVAFQAEPQATYVASGTTACRSKKLASNVILLPGLNNAALFPCVQTVTDASAGALKTQLTGWDSAVAKPGEAGTYAGLPVGGQGTLFYYNKSLFKKAGLDPAKGPTTWAEFEADCKALKAKGIDPVGISGADGYTAQWMFATLLAQFYPTPTVVDSFAKGDIKFNDPRTLKALKYVEEVYKNGWASKNYADKKFDAVEEDFIKGRVAIVPGIITDIMSWSVWDAKMSKGSYGVFPGPVVPGTGSSKTAQYFYPAILSSVAKDAPDPAAATKLSQYLVSKAGQTTMLKDSGTFPNRQDVDVVATTHSEGAAAIADILKTTTQAPSITTWLNSDAYAAFGTNLESALTSGKLGSYLDNVTKLQSQGQ